MRKFFKIVGIVLAAIVLICLVAYGVMMRRYSKHSQANMELLGAEAPVITEGGRSFRDLNKNGKLDVYEDTHAAIDARVEDLLSQMTLEEKAGTMFITMIGMTPDGEPMEKPIISSDMMVMMFSFMLPSNSELIAKKLMNNFNIINSFNANVMAHYNNQIQKMAERTRLGIPVSIATDPRHGTENNPGAALFTPSFSQWPSPLGLAATRDTSLVREFGDIARREYLSVGIRIALHPMADLATEPRWGRINGTFGEDAHLAAAMTKAYVLGFQGDTLGKNSIACMSKHFAGGGPQKDGEDPHFPYGKEQAYPGHNFSYHVIPFVEGALKAHTAMIMPYYGIPVGQTNEDVAFGFNKQIITGLLRDSLKFDGVVCTDWGLITDKKTGGARAWGVETLTPEERVEKVIHAGCDQFGGESVPELVVNLVRSNKISEARIDTSVRRILKAKFVLGLFDNPYVDEQKASEIAGKKEFVQKGLEAQRKSIVLLKNKNLLPLKKGTKVYAEGWHRPEVLKAYGELVDDPGQADVILKKIKTPFDPRNKYMLERFFHQGRLYYSEEEKAKILNLIQQKPAVVIVNLERPAILTDIDHASSALVAEFGSSDVTIAETLFGLNNPGGKLPFELPSSQAAVEKQLSDVPYDSENPLYHFGDGISY